ncbi:MAG: ParA family protein [Acidobacteria bacterium]|nr:ParA family protein [Acidobacteriota bacterium]
MSAPVVAFFNNKGGVGKTTLVYHLFWMMADLGKRVLAVDLDPQANLTEALLPEEELAPLFFSTGSVNHSIYTSVNPVFDGDSPTPIAKPFELSPGAFLIPGDLRLSAFEDRLASEWSNCLGPEPKLAMRIESVFHRLIQDAAAAVEADIVLVDVGPSLGAINRAVLIACDFIVTPLAADLFSLQALENVGPRLRQWREEWEQRLHSKSRPDMDLPAARMQPLGYVLIQHAVRLDRPTIAYQRWVDRIPEDYQRHLLAKTFDEADNHCLAQLRHYRSLMPMAHEARKPIFHLKPADGAIGAHYQAVQAARKDFRSLAEVIFDRIGG